MNIVYQKIAPAQVNLYREIRLESLKKAAERFCSKYEVEAKKSVLYFETCILEESANKFIVGAFSNGKLLGISGFYQSEDQFFKGNIVQMYVRPESQGRGIGRQLLLKTIAEGFKIATITQIKLDVLILPNDHLTKFYEQVGFKVTEIKNGQIEMVLSQES